jgi:hypothetical protein
VIFIKSEIRNQVLGFYPVVLPESDHLRWINSEKCLAFGTPDQGAGGFYSLAV